MPHDTPRPHRHPMAVTVAVCAGWVLLGLVAFVSVAILDFSVNFLVWTPSLPRACLPLGVHSLGLAGAWWLSGRTRGAVRVGAVVLVTGVLAAFGISIMAPEYGYFPSPFWYRCSRIALLLMPGAVFALRRGMLWRYARSKVRS